LKNVAADTEMRQSIAGTGAHTHTAAGKSTGG
jgi:uncharacterized protein YqfA (UPF0365 family)